MRFVGVSVMCTSLVTSCAPVAERAPSSPSSSNRQAVPAPIDGLDVRVLESNPPQYVLNVRAGLPSGCAERNRYETERGAEAITATVRNWMPTGNRPCTMIYGSYELNINLGSDFRPETTDSVSANDKKTSFIAQWGSGQSGTAE